MRSCRKTDRERTVYLEAGSCKGFHKTAVTCIQPKCMYEEYIAIPAKGGLYHRT